MQVNPIKTDKITTKQSLLKLLERYLLSCKDKSIVVITSKIVSICEGRVAKIGEVDKKELIEQEAEYYLPPDQNKYNITLTIKKNLLVPTAGIDESNGNGYYILWPKDPQKTANRVRAYLKKKFALRNLGVIITDSRTTPLRWGTTGIAIAHSGFSALNNYIGQPDIFGRPLHVTKANVVDALAAAAVLVMGEGNEQTPLALIEDVPFVKFQDRNPSKLELRGLQIPIKDDLYAALLKGVKWLRGKNLTFKSAL